MEAFKTVGPTTVDLLGITEEDARELSMLLIDVAPFRDEDGNETPFRRIYRALESAGIECLYGFTYRVAGKFVTVKRTLNRG